MIHPIPFALLLTLLVPPAILVALTTSSMTVGLLVCAMAWILFALATGRTPYALPRSDIYRLGALLGGIGLLTAHAIITNLQLGDVDFGRFAASCIVLAILLIGAHFAARKLERTPVAYLVHAANWALGVLTFLAIAAALGVPPIGPQASSKAVIVFSEPSHFALAYLPVLLFRLSIAKRRAQVLLLGMAFVLAIVLQSLTMIAGLLLVAALLLSSGPLALMLVVLAAGSLAMDITYFTSRLAFSSDTTNLSTLVLLQGWQNAILNFQETSGTGVGFQQFGVAGSIGDISDKIAELMGSNLSLYDGGSTCAKLIGEFGILGVIAVAALTRVIARSALYLRRSQRQSPRSRDHHRLLFCSFLVTYTVELFVRGTGYFAPGSFLAAVALIALASRKSARPGVPEENHMPREEAFKLAIRLRVKRHVHSRVRSNSLSASDNDQLARHPNPSFEASISARSVRVVSGADRAQSHRCRGTVPSPTIDS